MPGARAHTLLAVLTAAAPRPVSAGELVAPGVARRAAGASGEGPAGTGLPHPVAHRTAGRSSSAARATGSGSVTPRSTCSSCGGWWPRPARPRRRATPTPRGSAPRPRSPSGSTPARGSPTTTRWVSWSRPRSPITTRRARCWPARTCRSADHARAFDLLEPLAERHPRDEQLLARLLRAEAAARGVPAALTRYAAYAEETRDRLGSEPGEQLQRLHVELLARDAPVREGLKYDAAPMIGRDSDVAAIRALLDHVAGRLDRRPGWSGQDPDGAPGRVGSPSSRSSSWWSWPASTLPRACCPRSPRSWACATRWPPPGTPGRPRTCGGGSPSTSSARRRC